MAADALIFSMRPGKPTSPINLLRRWVFPACDELKFLRASRLTFRRTYSSWSHDQGVPGKMIAQLMGHAKVDTTLNVVYAQVLVASDQRQIASAPNYSRLFTRSEGSRL